MKKLLKVAACLTALLISVSAFAACGGTRSSSKTEKPVEGKFHLYVGNFNGGYGDAWLHEAKERFEKKYANVNFGNGEMGVQVLIDSRDRYSGAIDQRIASWPQQVILAENINYYKLVDRNGDPNLVADMTDVVNTPINYDLITGQTDTSFGTGDETLLDIMNPSMESYLNVKNEDKYYGVPFYEATVGIVYDIDMFEEYGFYYAADGYGDADGFVQDKDGNWKGQGGEVLGNRSSMTFAQAKEAGLKLGNGPDGTEGTYDDGTPATYDDFFKLCEMIESRGYEAMIWPGNTECLRYLNYLAYNLWTDYEGKEAMERNFSLSGTVTDLINMDSYNPATGTYTTYSENINSSNGYLMQKQAGKFEAIKFIEKLVHNEKYYDESLCFKDKNQYDTEFTYLNSIRTGKRYAMLIDGSWWQNEARNIFANMAVDYDESYSAENRRFGMLPLPKANSKKVGEKASLSFNTSTLILINDKTTKDNEIALKVAKQFVKFLHTHESLYKFNQITSSARPYSYTLTPEEEDGLTSVAKQNYDLHRATDFVFTYSQNNVVKNFPEYFSCSGYLVFQAGEKLYEIVANTLYRNPNMTAWDYFSSMINDHDATWWNSNFGNYIK